MVIKLNIHLIFIFILFIISYFIGSVRLPIGPIRLDFVFDFIILGYILLIYKKIDVKQILHILPFSLFIIYFAVWLLFNYSSLAIRDILFILIPIYYMVTYFVLEFLLKRINISTIYKLLSFYIVINFIFALLQYTNLFGLNSILSPYYEMLAFNNATDSNMALKLWQRPFGLTGNPTFLTFLLYLNYKMCSSIKKSKLISAIAFFTILLSGGRMVLTFVIVWEIFEFIYRKIKQIRSYKQLLKILIVTIFSLIAITLIILLSLQNIPYMREQIYEPLQRGTLFYTPSYTYRASMYQMLFENDLKTLLFGGFSYNSFEKLGIYAVDSEYVMRICQFGFVGFLLLYYPLIKLCIYYKFNIKALFILALCLSTSITNFAVTNYAFIFYITLYLILFRLYFFNYSCYVCNKKRKIKLICNV